MITILVPTDFSPTAKKAIEYAAFVAKRTNAKIIILHVYQIPVISVKPLHVSNPEQVKENIRLAEEKLKNIEHEVPALKDTSYGTKSLPMYWLAEFVEIINEQKADLIIMGTNGSSGIKEIILGSNTAGVIENAKIPVLAVPAKAQCAKIEKIGFAYDREFIENLTRVDSLIWFVRRFKSVLEVFHVKSKQDIASTQHQVYIHKLKLYLEKLPCSYSEIVDEDIEEGINTYIVERNIDMLVMMHRSRNLFERLFRRSFSKKMAFHTVTPLLVIPETK